MEKTLIQCRVINLKWLMTETAVPFTRTTPRVPEKETKAVRYVCEVCVCVWGGIQVFWTCNVVQTVCRGPGWRQTHCQTDIWTLMLQCFLVQSNQPELNIHVPVSLHNTHKAKMLICWVRNSSDERDEAFLCIRLKWRNLMYCHLQVYYQASHPGFGLNAQVQQNGE